DYYERTRVEYQERRDVMLRALRDAGFVADPPQGAYYAIADRSQPGVDYCTAAARHLVEDVGVAAVPGSSFFSEPALGAHLLRFAFPQRVQELREGRPPPAEGR